MKKTSVSLDMTGFEGCCLKLFFATFCYNREKTIIISYNGTTFQFRKVVVSYVLIIQRFVFSMKDKKI